MFTVVANWEETAIKLMCRKNHWEYENKQYTIENLLKVQLEMKKKFKIFQNCVFLGPFWKK